ncbi:hypothetical protein BY996DRAFT_138861 [Phakopsora pachyrhizi]|nr:hypothetical protein BY996DRAFT_138861 [Phakopsora pachyrhizi]
MTVLAAFKAGLMKQPETLTYKAPAQLPIIRILRNLGGSTNPEVKPRCECDLEASRKVTVKEGPNKGRAFLVCSRISKAAQCKYFKWEDELEGTVIAPVAGPSKYSSNGNENSYSKNFQARSTDTQMSNYTCYVCNQAGHFANNCPNRTEGSNKPQGSSSECYLCGKSDHWANNCPSKTRGSSSSRGTSRGGTSRRRGRGRRVETSASGRAAKKIRPGEDFELDLSDEFG